MALLLSEGFDAKTTLADLLRMPYSYSIGTALTITIGTTTGYFGGRCLSATGTELTNASVNWFDTSLGALVTKTLSGNKIRWGCWWRMNAKNGNGTTSQPIFALMGNDANACAFNVTCGNSGTGVIFFRQYTNLATVATGTIPILDDAYHWLEFEVVLSTTAGTIKVYVDGVLDINYSGVTASAITSGVIYTTLRSYLGIQSNAAQGISFTGALTTTRHLIDDLIIWDDQGSTFTTFPLGARRIYTQFPTSDASVTYTRSTGASNYLTVDELVSNTDVDYVDGTSVGNSDLYGVSALSSWSPGTINAVVVKTNNIDPNAGGRTYQHKVKLSGTTSNGATIAAPVAYQFQQTCFTTKPGGGAWAAADVGTALQFGYEVIA